MNNANALTQYQSEVIEALKSVANLGKPFEKEITLVYAVKQSIQIVYTEKTL